MLRPKNSKPKLTEEPSDFEKYGLSILDNTITDVELEELFKKYNCAGGQELNDIVKGFVKYMDIAQQYRLCQRLIPLEAKYNGLDLFLRNKSLTTLCLTALMNKVGYTDQLFQKFIACEAPHDFLFETLEIPEQINNLFHLAYSQFPNMSDTDQAKLAPNVVFFLITTPIISTAMQSADIQQAVKQTTAIKELMANTKSTLYCRFSNDLIMQIIRCPGELILPVAKSVREIENDCISLRNEARQLSIRDPNVLVSWPTVFTHINKTPEAEDKIQETRCHNMIRWYFDSMHSNNLSGLDRAVGDTVSMMDAIARKHPNWLSPALVNSARNVYLKAKEILAKAPDKDHRMKLLEIEIDMHLRQLPTAKATKEERQFERLSKKK